MRDLNTNWPPKHTCKMPCMFLYELKKDSMEIQAEDGGKNYTREEGKDIDR